jgi:hypothetical protein
MEVSLPQLQKISDELSATPGYRSFSSARALSFVEVLMTQGAGLSEDWNVDEI